jgi:hypothetical protein
MVIRKTELREANAMLVRLLEIKIVEKNNSGFFIKYFAVRAEGFFCLARISILILLPTINAISAAAKNAVNIRNTNRKIISLSI